MSSSSDILLEGRLKDPALSLKTEPRLDPRLRRLFEELGMAELAAPSTLCRPFEQQSLVAATGDSHAGFGGLYEALPNDLPGDPHLAFTSHEIPGPDGNMIAARVYRGAGADLTVPCIIYYHGGGMTILDAFAKVHDRWCQDLAAAGHVVVSVAFRNAYTANGLNPFPAGLKDCLAALRWVHARRARFGISKIILQGESGGGNLSLATAMLALKEGNVGMIDGVYANVPYISGGYRWAETRKRGELPSLVENNGYFIECSQMDLLVAIYDPEDEYAEHPLCWPYFATEADLKGLPPHVIAVNELDPLRDEGIAFYRKLIAAGIPARARINLGLTHAADLIFRQAIPDIYFAGIADIADFARTVQAPAPG